MAPHSSALACSRGRRSLVGCSSWGCWELDTTEWLHFDFSLSCIGEGNGNPLQCSCLENPRDGGLPSMGSHRVGHDWSDLAAAAAAVCIYWSQTTNLSLPTPFPFGNRSLFSLLCIYFGCSGSSLLHAGFLWLQSGGYSLVALCRLLTAVTSLVAEHRLQVHGLQWLKSAGSAVAAFGL